MVFVHHPFSIPQELGDLLASETRRSLLTWHRALNSKKVVLQRSHFLSGGGLFIISLGCSTCVVGMVSMVVFSSVVSVVSFLTLGLLAEPVISPIARLLCFPFDFAWFCSLSFLEFLLIVGSPAFLASCCRSMREIPLILTF